MTSSVLKRNYHNNSAADAYIVGFIRDGKVYYVTVQWNQLRKWLRDSRTSSAKGGVLQIKVYMPAAEQDKAIANGSAVLLCSVEALEAVKAENNGSRFERLIIETLTPYGYKKNRTPFYEAGDVEIFGIQYQIKLNYSTLTDEKIIKNMLKKLRG